MFTVYNSQGIPVMTTSTEEEAAFWADMEDGYYK